MSTILDMDELDRQTFGDLAIRRDVIGLFQEQAPALLAALAGVAGSARADIAHRIKGSALALGARALADAAAALEASPDDETALTEVRRLTEATRQALAGLL